MKQRQTLNWLGLLLLALWLPSLGMLFPSPNETISAIDSAYRAKMHAASPEVRQPPPSASSNENDIQKQITFIGTKVWLEWTMIFLFVTAGILSSMAAVFRWKYWGGFAALMASLSVAGTVLQYQAIRSPLLDAWIDAAQASMHSESWVTVISFFSANLVQPCGLLSIAAYLVYYRPDVRARFEGGASGSRATGPGLDS